MLLRRGVFKKYNSFFSYVFKISDLVLLMLALVISAFVLEVKASVMLMIGCFFITAGIYYKFNEFLRLYSSWRVGNLKTELVLLALSSLVGHLLAMLVVSFSRVFFPDDPSLVSPPVLANWFLLSIGLHMGFVLGERILFRSFLRLARARGLNERRVIIVGSGLAYRKIASQVRAHPEYGLKVLGYVRTNPLPSPSSTHPRYLGQIENLEAICAGSGVDQIWLATPVEDRQTINLVLEQLAFSTYTIRQVLDFTHLQADADKLTSLSSVPLLDIEFSPLDSTMSRLVKDLEDKCIAALALLLLSPLLLVIAAGVKLTSPGPVLYRQKRMTWNRQHFDMLKFRTMPVGSDQTSSGWSSKHKANSSRFASFLRSTSLDELPQLINVLKGDMSIVGPRPERPEYVEQFKHDIPRYMKKHMVKAGITGWAQVNGYRGETDLSKRIEYDLYYIRNWTPAFDLYIMWQTLFKGLVHQNAY